MGTPTFEPPVTVVVPTRDRPRCLTRCLEALQRQEGVGDIQVLVVDDGSVHAAEIECIVGRLPRASVLRNTRPRGPGAARNAGVQAARTEIILFTDDDCEPARHWVRHLAQAVDDGAAAATGRLVNGRPADPFAAASEAIAEYMRRQARTAVSSTAFATPNNLACSARLLREICFDERYHYAEDRDWCARLLAAGHSLVVEQSAVVVHHQDLTIRSFWCKHVEYGRGAYRFRRKHSAGLLEPPRFYSGLLRAGFTHGALPGLLVGVAQLATAVGFTREARSQRRTPPASA